MAGKTVLVVDDQPGMTKLIKFHLERDGHIVTTVNSGLDALAASDAGARFDVYILDIQMPQGQPTGLSLWRMLDLSDPAATFIFVTGDPGLATHAEFVGRVVLGKPLDLAALRRAVTKSW